MSRSLLYAVNTSAQNVPVNGVISPGTVMRRFGQNINLAGTGISLAGQGYYTIDASFVVAPTAEGEVTITAYADGNEIAGMSATATAAAAGDFVTLPLVGVIREGCPCCETMKTITFKLSDTASTVTNSAIVVEKV